MQRSLGKNHLLPAMSCAMAQPFLTAALQHGLLAEPFLAPSGLSFADVQKGEALMSGQHWYDLADEVAKAVGNPHLGYEIGNYAALESLPNLSILRTEGVTLSELLMALIIDVKRLSSMANYRIETDGYVVRVFSIRTFLPSSPPAQVDGYYFGFMVRLVNACCGPDWHPKSFKAWICKPHVVPIEVRDQVSLRRGNRMGTRIEFPSKWMLLRFGGGQNQDLPSVSNSSFEFLGQIRKALELHLDKPGLSLEGFAALMSQGPSNLRRKFREHGTTFQKELTALRRSRAEALLSQSDLPLRSIGEKIGFSDPPSFSRSFKGWTGLPPGEYRKRLRSGDREH